MQDFGEDSSTESELEDDAESGEECTSDSEVEDENDMSNEEEWTSTGERKSDGSEDDEVDVHVSAEALKKLVPYSLEDFENVRLDISTQLQSEENKHNLRGEKKVSIAGTSKMVLFGLNKDSDVGHKIRQCCFYLYVFTKLATNWNFEF